jgi:hypothetical protein
VKIENDGLERASASAFYFASGNLLGTIRTAVAYYPQRRTAMTFFLWLIVLFFCWPLALLAIVLYPIVWLFLLPFRIVGIAVDGVLELVRAVIFLPARVLGGGRRY